MIIHGYFFFFLLFLHKKLVTFSVRTHTTFTPNVGTPCLHTICLKILNKSI